MKLKYYLRGLGIGIAVTTLVFGLSGRKESLTDEEIKARAAELGMVENTLLSDLKENESLTELASEEQSITEEPSITAESESETAESEETETETAETETEALETETEALETETSETEAETPEMEPGTTKSEVAEAAAAESDQEPEEIVSKPEETVKMIPFTIRSGETSWPVAQRIQEAGLVKDARAFDNFLCDSGYSRYLRAGSYQIPVGASEEEIAKILSRKN